MQASTDSPLPTSLTARTGSSGSSDAVSVTVPADEARLVRAHLPLVHQAVASIATRVPRHVSRDDLVSAAMLALAQAARSYEPDRGVPFDRYAMLRIRGALVDELRSADWASRPTRTMGRRLADADNRLAQRLARRPTTAEVAGELGLDVAAVHKLNDDLDRATVLNYESIVLEGDGEDVLPSGGADPQDVIEERERRAYLQDAVAALPERLRAVVVGYFFEERPMQELADELGVSESRVSQMRAEALVLLKDGINAHLDPDAVAPAERPDGIVARRRAAYYAAVAGRSDFRSRLSAAPITVPGGHAVAV